MARGGGGWGGMRIFGNLAKVASISSAILQKKVLEDRHVTGESCSSFPPRAVTHVDKSLRAETCCTTSLSRFFCLSQRAEL